MGSSRPLSTFAEAASFDIVRPFEVRSDEVRSAESRPCELRSAPAPYALSVEPQLVMLRYGRETIAASTCAIRVERPGEAPIYFVPAEDVAATRLESSQKTVPAPGLGRARLLHVHTCDGRLEEAAYALEETTPLGARLSGRVGFDARRFERETTPISWVD